MSVRVFRHNIRISRECGSDGGGDDNGDGNARETLICIGARYVAGQSVRAVDGEPLELATAGGFADTRFALPSPLLLAPWPLSLRTSSTTSIQIPWKDTSHGATL